MIEAVHRYEGYIVQSTGDGIFALFGAPVAHEDHPQHPFFMLPASVLSPKFGEEVITANTQLSAERYVANL
jgi:class 3 adenylate cyclase